MANNNTNTDYWKILLTAVLTGIVTILSQQFIESLKQDKEHEYWQKRYFVEGIDKLNSQRLQLLGEISQGILQLEIQAKEIKINAAAAKYGNSMEQFDKLNNLMITYHKDLYKYASKVQTVSFFFDSKVDSLIPILGKTLELNFQNNLLINESQAKIPGFDLDFETIDTLEKTRNLITLEMANEIMDSYKLKFEE